MGVCDFVPTEPTEGACAVEVLKGCPEVLALPVIDEAADEGLLKSSETSQSGGSLSRSFTQVLDQRPDTLPQLRYCVWSIMYPGKRGCLSAHSVTGLPLLPMLLFLGHPAQTCTHPLLLHPEVT